MINLEEELKAIQEAKERIAPVLLPTRMITSEYYSQVYGNQVFLKPENLQRTGSFKLRGAFNMISRLSEDDRNRGIVTASAGNHAQGVGYSGQYYHCPCTIVMPETTPLLKIDSAREKGAKVVLFGQNYDAAYCKAMEIAKQEGQTFVHAYNMEDVYRGQGTIGLELLEENPDLDIVLVPIGGGGLISGVAMALKALKPSIRVVGVEAEGAASMKGSMAVGEVVTLESLSTCAEGVAVRTVGDKTFEICDRYVDEIVTVSEREIMESVVILMERHKLVVETSGALSVAALRKISCKRKNIACLLTGGNIDMVTISSLITKGLVSRGRILCFNVELNDSPGQLHRISGILCETGANVIALQHDQLKVPELWGNRVVLEVTVETNGHEHIANIITLLREAGYSPHRVY